MEDIAKQAGVDINVCSGGGIAQYEYLSKKVVRLWFSAKEEKRCRMLEGCVERLKNLAPHTTDSDSKAIVDNILSWEMPIIPIAKFLCSRLGRNYLTAMECVGDIIGQGAIPDGTDGKISSLLTLVNSCISLSMEQGVNILHAREITLPSDESSADIAAKLALLKPKIDLQTARRNIVKVISQGLCSLPSIRPTKKELRLQRNMIEDAKKFMGSIIPENKELQEEYDSLCFRYITTKFNETIPKRSRGWYLGMKGFCQNCGEYVEAVESYHYFGYCGRCANMYYEEDIENRILNNLTVERLKLVTELVLAGQT